MIFSKQLDFIFSALGCTNDEISRISGIPAAIIDSMRHGGTVPNQGSTQAIMLVFGLCKYAGDNKKSAVLAKSCSAPSSANRYALNQALTACLFPSAASASTTAPVVKNLFPHSIQQSSRAASERLDNAMKLVGINNISVSKSTGIDASLISRYRSGARAVVNKTDVVSSIFSCLYQAAFSNEKTAEFAEMIKISEKDFISGEEKAFDAFLSWLRDSADFFEYTAVAHFLSYFDQLSESKAADYANSALNINKKWIPNESTDAFYGPDGLRSAFTRLLNEATDAPGVHTLFLYSDQSLNWFVDDFSETAFKLLGKFLSNGKNKIKVIINIDQNNPNMFFSIEKCLPLFAAGQMEPFYCKKINNSRFSHTLFMVESIGAVCSYFVSGTDEQAEHLYISEPQKLAYCKTQADALMRLSAPLMNIYNNKNSEEFSPIVEEFSRQKGNSVAIFPSLPVCTMSEKLIDSILERENVDEETSAAIREFCTLRKLLFKKSLAGHTSFMLPIPPAYIENGIRFSSNHFLNTDNIYYTKEEYNEHIRTIIEILKRENNLDFVLLDDSKLRHTQILSKENGGVLITKCTAPVTAMYFTHPFICKSIHGYLKKIAESIAPADKNKYDIIRLLEQQLNN